jgi:cytochrome c peroxidase
MNPIEMAETPDHLVAQLRTVEGYHRQFGRVFGTDVSLQGIVEAIATYERTLISSNSAFDRYMLGDGQAMSASAISRNGPVQGESSLYSLPQRPKSYRQPVS